MNDRQSGVIKTWNDDKGFGFISPAVGGADIFFHVGNVTNSGRRDLLGQAVTFVPGVGRYGKPAAVCIQLEEPGPSHRHSMYRRLLPVPWPAWVLSCAFLAAVCVVAFSGYVPKYVPAAYLVMSLVTFIKYYIDKKSAEDGSWRVSEKTLHLLEFAFGWPGALIAQWQLHHKNRKGEYQVLFWFIVIVHMVAIGAAVQQKGSWRYAFRHPGNKSTGTVRSGRQGITVEWSAGR